LTSNYGLPKNSAQGGIERVKHPDEQKGKAALATYIVTYEICFSHLAKQVKKWKIGTVDKKWFMKSVVLQGRTAVERLPPM
jgi:hypothetical protein